MGWGIFFGLWILGNDFVRGCETIAEALKEQKDIEVEK